MNIRLKNIPLPEAFILAIGLSLVLQLLSPMMIFELRWIGHIIGWPFAILGIFVSLWAAREAGEMSISAPDELLTSGPYALSRNPMYLGWALIYAGLSFILNSIWSLSLFPIALAYIHFIEIRQEEKHLQEKFGDRYNQYCERVPRYL